MPIVDGLTSTKMIRSHEKTHPNAILSNRASINGRVPIFAVSASLVEKEKDRYIDCGFDGWILKPIDFRRLNVLIDGIVRPEVRRGCLYTPGEWERGGWFCQESAGVSATSTKPSSLPPFSASEAGKSFSSGSTDAPEDQERQRMNRLDTDAVHAASGPENAGQSGSLEHSVEGS